MINNLAAYFMPEQEIFLNDIQYRRAENIGRTCMSPVTLLCQDNVKAAWNDEGVKIIITRSLNFDPNVLFDLSVSFGAILKFNEKKNELDWKLLNLAEEFSENGEFITGQLMSRISLLIGQITSSYGQPPIILPTGLAKK